MLSEAVMLVHPQPNAPTCVTTDASNSAVGGVLEQFIDGQWKPISFFSKKLCHAETNYSTFDRELLAIYLAVRHFQHFVEGRTFHINTDHKPLTFVLQSSSDRRYSFIEGQANQVADELSRNVHVLEQSPIDFEALAIAQQRDDQLQHLQTSDTSLPLEQVPILNSTHTLLCDVSQGRPRPLIRHNLRRDIFNSLHAISPWCKS